MPIKSVVICALASSIALSACQNSAQSIVKDNAAVTDVDWTLVWSDEFNGEGLDRTKWEAETACWGGGNYERQCYTDRPENIEVSDGMLRLKARAEPFTAREFAQDKADRGAVVTQSYTSGKIRTKDLSAWQYGRFEARIKLPQGQGTWPAFWMLPEDNVYGQWPLSGEIDIMEAVNLGAVCTDCGPSTTENRSMGSLHYGQLWPNNEFQTGKHILPEGIEAFHIFSVEWREDKIDWFVNNQPIFSMTADQWYSAAADKDTHPFAPFDQPFHLILNLAVGGQLPENRNEKRFEPNAFPDEVLVDWVRVYQRKDG